ncbi:hypothetical protein EST38_g696 [Candolleomyces aberdarensis]|uniref:DUF1857-domain-containing protein n=1 Tax=Candolleomyces aberdarensis TaxID=2316362 RepID=A0A4Q2DZG3_9AGAR|nr:hypothetical protein EST38_g696 [Candolleomyces aberdarensis]
MSTNNIAGSRRINPPGASPKLTEAQVWKGLEIKARDPADFVPSVTSCEVVKDTEKSVTRVVSFGGNPPITEEIEIHTGAIIYFNSADIGTSITNTLSYDEDGELILTFSFAGGIPGTQASDLPPSREELGKRISAGVQHTISTIRKLVQNGTITV